MAEEAVQHRGIKVGKADVMEPVRTTRIGFARKLIQLGGEGADLRDQFEGGGDAQVNAWELASVLELIPIDFLQQRQWRVVAPRMHVETSRFSQLRPGEKGLEAGSQQGPWHATDRGITDGTYGATQRGIVPPISICHFQAYYTRYPAMEQLQTADGVTPWCD
jgi:hypothetical protein